MATAAATKVISKKAAYLRLAVVSLVALAVLGLGVVFLYFEAPIQGDACSVEHATTQDAIGHTMACDPKVGGSRELVWHYASDADVEVQTNRAG